MFSPSNETNLQSASMVFTDEDKAVIKNDYLEKEWKARRICKEHPTKKWNFASVHRLLKRFEEHGYIPGGSKKSTTRCKLT